MSGYISSLPAEVAPDLGMAELALWLAARAAPLYLWLDAITGDTMALANVVLLDDRGILTVAGPDRRTFLQGLVSNDVMRVMPDRAGYAALLTAQGKYLHDFIMVERDEAIWLDAERARLADLKRRLAMYRLRAKIEIAERPDLAVAAVFGEGAAALFDLAEEPGAARPYDGGVALVDPRLAALGLRIVAERGRVARIVKDRPDLAAADAAANERHRIPLGISEGSRDLVPEKTILLEAGFDELHGVDWQKGCYVGQELTARTKYRGLIKKRLFPVRIEGPVPAPGTIATQGAADAGEIRSARDGLGLALLRLDAVAAGTPLACGAATLAPIKPDWMRLPGDEVA
jgi:folate-binding protein YgfZ